MRIILSIKIFLWEREFSFKIIYYAKHFMEKGEEINKHNMSIKEK